MTSESARDGMLVPFQLESLAVCIYLTKEEVMEEPQVIWVIDVEVVSLLQASKKALPSTGKLRANFNPHAFSTSVVSRPPYQMVRLT